MSRSRRPSNSSTPPTVGQKSPEKSFQQSRPRQEQAVEPLLPSSVDTQLGFPEEAAVWTLEQWRACAHGLARAFAGLQDAHARMRMKNAHLINALAYDNSLDENRTAAQQAEYIRRADESTEDDTDPSDEELKI